MNKFYFFSVSRKNLCSRYFKIRNNCY